MRDVSEGELPRSNRCPISTRLVEKVLPWGSPVRVTLRGQIIALCVIAWHVWLSFADSDSFGYYSTAGRFYAAMIDRASSLFGQYQWLERRCRHSILNQILGPDGWMPIVVAQSLPCSRVVWVYIGGSTRLGIFAPVIRSCMQKSDLNVTAALLYFVSSSDASSINVLVAR